MTKVLISCLLAAAPLSGLAAATPVDNYAATAIANAEFAPAEAALSAKLRRAPSDQPALLNLAYVYRHTARERQANQLYSRVLERNDVQVADMNGNPVSAHKIAQAGLSGTVTIASR